MIADSVRSKICNEVGDVKYCILVDESVNESNKKHMAIILRHVDGVGFVRERFFEVVCVDNTCILILKEEICNVLNQSNLLVENLRGQGYGDASSMHGKWNRLQTLFIKDCLYAYYVHCFAHRLQLVLFAVSKEYMMYGYFFLN